MDELMKHLNGFKISARRIETLPVYKIEDDEWEEYQNYINGVPEHSFEPSDWFRTVVQHTKNGRVVERIRVIPEEINPYIIFEFETGYVPHSVAGEKIHTISIEKYNALLSQIKKGDFWIFDDETVLEMIYSDDGKFLGTNVVDESFAVQEFIRSYDKIKKDADDFSAVLKIIRNKSIKKEY
ncbi:MAG: hypothetical protein PHN72_01580 [Bacilli bacterium]|nr:hypothetical protein [Bacilli bacterium]